MSYIDLPLIIHTDDKTTNKKGSAEDGGAKDKPKKPAGKKGGK